jgi:hypothetical protein
MNSEVKCPIAILGAETDHLSPPELVKQFEVVLAEKSEVSFHTKFVARDNNESLIILMMDLS